MCVAGGVVCFLTFFCLVLFFLGRDGGEVVISSCT